jgi:dTMP kinase
VTDRGGTFIAIEGGEGAGKGSVLVDLATRLQARGFDVVTTREPGGTPEGQQLRELLLGVEGKIWDPWSELLLMTAARVQHVRKLIIPAIARGNIVISDRFIGSTIAYQGAGRKISVDEISQLHRVAVGNVWPELTILLDVDPRTGLRRSQARLQAQSLDEGRFETMDISFHERVRESFLKQASDRPDAHIVIDAGLPFATVAEAVAKAVLRWLPES